MDELKSCPFCGGRAVKFATQYGNHIECEKYDPMFHRVQISALTENEAIEEWNRRADNVAIR